MGKTILLCLVASLALALALALVATDGAKATPQTQPGSHVKVAAPQNAVPRGRLLDSDGNAIADDSLMPLDVAAKERQSGQDVVLTIDGDLQKIAAEEVGKAAREWLASSVIAVMADPKTGAILAAAQWPPVDRSQPDKTIDYISQFQFGPESMMKGLTMTIALDIGYTTLDSKFDCGDNSGLGQLSDTTRLGTLAVREIIQKASNIGTARVALLVPPEVLYGGFKDFGLGTATGIGVHNEYRGFLEAPNQWRDSSHSRIPIGYAGSATPLQLVQAYAAIANKGCLMQLRLIDSIRQGGSTIVVSSNPPRELRKVAGEKASATITSALMLCTQKEGHAVAAAIPGYPVAGMTGTVHEYIEPLGCMDNILDCSFIGFAPADQPAVVLLVTVIYPNNGKLPYCGNSVAGPVFARIAERTLKHLNVKPEVTQDKPELGR
jgi:cell division protein FtsI/penicillin-binding protein 2